MQILRRLGTLAVTVALEVAVVAGLARLGRDAPFTVGWSHPLAWLRAAEPIDAVAALVRVAALGAAVWLLAITVACALVDLAAPRAAGHGVPAAIRRATPRSIRHVVDRAVLVAVMGVAAVPGVASAEPTGVRDGRAAPTVTTAPPPPPTSVPVANASTPRAPTAAAPNPAAATASTAATVTPGDNLWVLAAARLAAATGRPRTAIPDAEIARYWVQVCDANRTRLRSGDVDLVFPGEVVVLPAVPGPGADT